MDKLLFIYDKLMTAKEQNVANLKLQFISFAQIKAKGYWLNDDKQRRIFVQLSPEGSRSTNLFYGGLFLLKGYEENKHKLHSYYNNSFPYLNMTVQEDLYELANATAYPIKFNSLRDVEKCNYEHGTAIECFCFVGNARNKKIQYCMKRRGYYRQNNVDSKSFIQLIKDKKNTK